GLLVIQLARCRAGDRGHEPQAARAMNVPAVRHEQQRLAVARPGWIDLVVVGAVVVARQWAAVLAREALRLHELRGAHVGDKDVEVPLISARHVRDSPPVRRPAWLDVDRPAVRQLRAPTGLEVEQPELDRPTRARGIYDEPSTG